MDSLELKRNKKHLATTHSLINSLERIGTRDLCLSTHTHHTPRELPPTHTHAHTHTRSPTSKSAHTCVHECNHTCTHTHTQRQTQKRYRAHTITVTAQPTNKHAHECTCERANRVHTPTHPLTSGLSSGVDGELRAQGLDWTEGVGETGASGLSAGERYCLQ